MLENKQLPLFGLVLAIGLIISTYILSDMIKYVKMSHQIIKVRGYSEKDVESDLSIWKMNIVVKTPQVAEGYTILENNTNKTVDFLKNNGIDETEMKVFSVKVNTIMKKNEKGYNTETIDHYNLIQNIEITSKDVKKIDKLSTQISQLIKQGIYLNINAPRYYYTKVNDLKSTLLTEATKDAKFRAETLAKGSGVSLGYLKAARQGSFKIRSGKISNISSPSEYDQDDVLSIKKKVTAVITVDYSMK